MKLDAHKLGLAGAIVAALSMILMSILYSMGIYQEAVSQMQSMHMFYEPTFGGTVSGLIEAAVMTYIVLYVTALIYNHLLSAKK